MPMPIPVRHASLPNAGIGSSSAPAHLYDLQQALAMPTLPSLTFSSSSEADEHELHLEHIRTHQYDNQFPAPLGPFASLPSSSQAIKDWRILILVTSVNSFAQKVVAYFDFLGIHNYAVHVASSAEGMTEAAHRFRPDVVVCPFLTARIPESVFTRWITLVVHPGPPGDAGPSSLDWVLMGDTGRESDSASALSSLLSQPVTGLRSHWGTICFQANEEMDGGAVWAWEQYPLPALGSITKAQLYQGLHSSGAMLAMMTALLRINEQVRLSSTANPRDSSTWMRLSPRPAWSRLSISSGKPFLGGATHERPLLQSKSRRPDFAIHTARDVQRIIAAGDSQPGGQLPPLSSAAKTNLFAYGSHVHDDPSTVPANLYAKYGSYEAVPDGTILAQRDGAVFIKTLQKFGAGAGVWVTHGRLPKKSLKDPLDPKVPMVDAIAKSGHASVLEGLPEWPQDSFEYVEGTWQEVYVKREEKDGALAMTVYWNFYNGACSTTQCQHLLRALQWATRPERGNVRILALMGGTYFSNGIALNTIENAVSPGKETWDNINAIDDIVEFLLSDSADERSPSMQGEKSLSERGIATVACVRSNAAAGGVALAAACDVVICARGAVLNPAYRAMGLHGSEFHSFSYAQRTGAHTAAQLLRDMTPMSSTDARHKGLVDIEIGSYDSSAAEVELGMLEHLRAFITGYFDHTNITAGSRSTLFACAPWSAPGVYAAMQGFLLDSMCASKAAYLAAHPRPLLDYRNEELSQMLLDSFHPVRSKRYHTRREAFIRKYKSSGTPARYARELARGAEADEEDGPDFDAAPGWTRGEEWAWAGLPIPKSLERSECTRVDLFPELSRQASQALSESGSEYDGDAYGRKGSIGSFSVTSASMSDAYSSATTADSANGLPATPPSDTLVQGRFPSSSPLINEIHASAIVNSVNQKQTQQYGRTKGKQMGMQGFEAVELDELKGLGLGKGDVQFPCLYQAEPERL